MKVFKAFDESNIVQVGDIVQSSAKKGSVGSGSAAKPVVYRKEEAAVAPERILGFDLSLYDTQPAALGGSQGEFLYSARLDNLVSCFAAVEALAEYSDARAGEDEDVALVALFDHEEVDSGSLLTRRTSFYRLCRAHSRLYRSRL